MDVPAPASGVVGEILAKIGDKVSMGVALLTLEEEGAAAPAPAAPTPAPAAPAPAPASPPARRYSLRLEHPEKVGRRARQRFRSGGRAQSSCGRLLRRQRRTRRSPSRAGTRHRPDDDLGLGRERPHHARGRQGGAERRRVGAAAKGGAALPEIPAVDFAKFGPVETVPLSRIKRISGLLAPLRTTWPYTGIRA